MTIFDFFRPTRSAPVARDRLQILLQHERVSAGASDLIAILREEILEVISRHVEIPAEKVQVKMQRDEAISTLEVEIELPNPIRRRAAA
ncbi:MAG TPA: cell division topological specificity factor MinE [Kaistia sp.]|nr:cell division topological specificity factor MinE [Kaistia sp.]